MQKFICMMVMSLFLMGPVLASNFEGSDIKILKKEEIDMLSDEKLTDAYVDLLVELEAQRTFYLNSSFLPKQYKEYKDLLKYRLQLLMEIHSRNLELPPQMER
jgi:hypothetical protein